MKKRGQISFEYLMIMGFITFVLMVLLGVALYYSSEISDRLKVIQIQNYAKKIVASAETVFYAGSPSKVTFMCDLPDGVKSITVAGPYTNGYGTGIIINYTSVGGGITSSFYQSNVPINITADGCGGGPSATLCQEQGTRNIIAEATENGTNIHYPA
jgi:hypothetical protein